MLNGHGAQRPDSSIIPLNWTNSQPLHETNHELATQGDRLSQLNVFSDVDAVGRLAAVRAVGCSDHDGLDGLQSRTVGLPRNDCVPPTDFLSLLVRQGA